MLFLLHMFSRAFEFIKKNSVLFSLHICNEDDIFKTTEANQIKFPMCATHQRLNINLKHLL